MMKKMVLAVAVLGLACGMAQAQISINWIDNTGVTQSDGTTPWLAGGGTAVAQLLYSPGGVIAPATPSGPSGDNVVWDSGSFTSVSVGNDYGATFSALYQDPTFLAGSVFIRIFEADASITAPGTWYYDGVLVAVADDPDPAQQVNLGPINSGTGDFNTWQLDQQVIPEPSVFAMLGLGGLFLMIRRRFVA
jgi:hypothetical protein